MQRKNENSHASWLSEWHVYAGYYHHNDLQAGRRRDMPGPGLPGIAMTLPRCPGIPDIPRIDETYAMHDALDHQREICSIVDYRFTQASPVIHPIDSIVTEVATRGGFKHQTAGVRHRRRPWPHPARNTFSHVPGRPGRRDRGDRLRGQDGAAFADFTPVLPQLLNAPVAKPIQLSAN